jgi:hypothetical protein
MSLALGLVALAAHASAAPPRSVKIVGDERGCPTPGQVSGLLAPLLPASRIAASGGPPALDDITISDDGASFSVLAAGQERSFVDPVRECLERARHAAVFVALALDPPAVSSVKPPGPDRAETPIEVAVVKPPSHVDLALGALLASAPGSSPRADVRAGGVAMRIRWGRELYGSAGVGFFPGSLHYQSADAKVLWFPIDMALGLNIRSADYELGGEIGPAVTVFGVLGQNLLGASRQWRADAGARVAVTGRAWIGERFGFFLSAQVAAFFRPYKLRVDPAGPESDVGATPWFWWGTSAGVFARID